jgi:hypothetical protein
MSAYTLTLHTCEGARSDATDLDLNEGNRTFQAPGLRPTCYNAPMRKRHIIWKEIMRIRRRLLASRTELSKAPGPRPSLGRAWSGGMLLTSGAPGTPREDAAGCLLCQRRPVTRVLARCSRWPILWALRWPDTCVSSRRRLGAKVGDPPLSDHILDVCREFYTQAFDLADDLSGQDNT